MKLSDLTDTERKLWQAAATGAVVDLRVGDSQFDSPEKWEEWGTERDRDRMAAMLNESAAAVREAVKSKVEAGAGTNLHYDHPILLIQHMIWHEGYHQGQIKLALKLAGLPISDRIAGPGTWGVWMKKRQIISERADL